MSERLNADLSAQLEELRDANTYKTFLTTTVQSGARPEASLPSPQTPEPILVSTVSSQA